MRQRRRLLQRRVPAATTACTFQEAEHPAYTTIARDVALCGGSYTNLNIRSACASGWHVCLVSEWQARFTPGTAPGGTLSTFGASQATRCLGSVWQARRPTDAMVWTGNVCGSAYNPWNSGKYLYGNDNSTLMIGNGSCCSWDSSFTATAATGGYAVYCCR